MRIVWKDTYRASGFKPFKYRGVMINGHPNGWTTDMPGDNNIYQAKDDAMNYIDRYFGGEGFKGSSKRRLAEYGEIRIIGKKNETA
jgi:hypothetical protein